MSIFGSIMSRIFSHPAAAAEGSVPPATTAAQQPSPAAPAPAAVAPPAPHPAAASPQAPAAPPGATTPAAPATEAPQHVVDVEVVLTAMASSNPQKLDWRHSIVDLLKLLDLDSSFDARKELAHELHYSGDSGDSAAMNIWLHRQVMNELAQNGGKVPEDLRQH